MAKPIDILMVHGSWHGGWAWDGIAPLLREQGHRVLTPCLQGLGSDAANLRREIGLYAHVDQLEALVQKEDLRTLVLVGHSYGGALVHALEGRLADRLVAVVHLEGAVPEPGRAIIDIWDEERRSDTLKAIAEQGGGWRVPPPDPRTWGALGEEQIAWLMPKLTDQPIKTYRETMPLSDGGADCPHYYLFADDRDPQPYADVIQRFRQTPTWQIAATKGGHELIFTNPDAVLAVIHTAAEAGRLPEKL
ncbi:MAG: alpha/beta fold hydrolase [Geminicoccaceae bacterium]